MEKFDITSIKKLRSTGKAFPDPSMYIGSGGVLFGLYKYILYLRADKANKEKLKTKIEELEDKLAKALHENELICDKLQIAFMKRPQRPYNTNVGRGGARNGGDR